MQKRSLFSRIFGSDNNTSPPATATEFKLYLLTIQVMLKMILMY